MTLLGLLLGLSTHSIPTVCTAAVVYSEARGESTIGQLAVAQTVVNRVASPRWPSTACGVAFQRNQFSGITYLIANRSAKADARAWEQAVEIAVYAQLRGPGMRGCDRATHFAASTVRPAWAKHMQTVCTIDHHTFYLESK